MLIKKLILYTLGVISLFLISYNVHHYLTLKFEIYHPYSLWSVYIYQAVASYVLVVVFELLASLTKEFKDQLGFLYLGSMAVKVLFFCVLFRDVIFFGPDLSKIDSVSLLLPIFIFIFYEVIVIVKILNRETQN